jgi:hypothetical protein
MQVLEKKIKGGKIGCCNTKKRFAVTDKPKASEPKQKRNSPVWKTTELMDAICNRLTEGESLRSICRDDGMPSLGTFLRWVTQDVELKEQYALALKVRADYLLEEIFEIADDSTNDYVEKLNKDGSTYVAVDSEHINRSRLRVDVRKWSMGRMNPKKYGDFSKMEVTGADGGAVEVVNKIERVIISEKNTSDSNT